MKQFRARQALAISLSVFWNNKISFLALTVICVLPVGQITNLVEWLIEMFLSMPDHNDSPSKHVRHLTHLLEVFLAVSLLKGVLSYGTFRELSGKHAGFKELYSRTDKLTFWRFALKIILICCAYSLVPALILSIPAVAMSLGLISPEHYFVAGVILMIGFLYLAIRYYVVVPVAVNEHTTLFNSFRRSSQLTASFRWGVFRVLSLLSISIFVLILIVSFSVPAVFPDSESEFYYNPINGTSQLVFLAFTAMFAAVDGVVSTVCYVYFRFKMYSGFFHSTLASVPPTGSLPLEE